MSFASWGRPLWLSWIQCFVSQKIPNLSFVVIEHPVPQLAVGDRIFPFEHFEQKKAGFLLKLCFAGRREDLVFFPKVDRQKIGSITPVSRSPLEGGFHRCDGFGFFPLAVKELAVQEAVMGIRRRQLDRLGGGGYGLPEFAGPFAARPGGQVFLVVGLRFFVPEVGIVRKPSDRLGFVLQKIGLLPRQDARLVIILRVAKKTACEDEARRGSESFTHDAAGTDFLAVAEMGKKHRKLKRKKEGNGGHLEMRIKNDHESQGGERHERL